MRPKRKNTRDGDVISYWQSQSTNMIPRYILLPSLDFKFSFWLWFI